MEQLIFFQMLKNQKLHCIATIAANGFWDIFTKKGIDIKKLHFYSDFSTKVIMLDK